VLLINLLFSHLEPKMSFHKSLLLKPLRANIPIVNLVTPDPRASIRKEQEMLKGHNIEVNYCEWDLIRGISPKPLKEKSETNDFLVWLNIRSQEQQTSIEILTQNPVECLNWFFKFLTQTDNNYTLLWFHNAHLFLASEGVQQCINNLREPLKERHSLLVLLSPEEISFQAGASITKGLPAALKEDILILEESHLSDEEILEQLDAFIDNFAGEPVQPLMREKRPQALELLRGFSPFQTEQLIALSLSKDLGIDLEYLAAERTKLITSTSGLSLYKGTETFEDIQGCANIKQFLTRILNNEARAPKAIVFIDEIEKSLAGIAGDLSGVSQDYLGQMLSWMQDKQVAGMLFVGPPGTAKSAIAKITGNEGGIPSIIFDLGGLKGSLVGESEKNLRKCLKIINTLSQERILLIATSNNIDILPPEMKRRFNLGTFFFDLPTQPERDAIWAEYCKKFSVSLFDGSQVVIDTNWTGAEIRNCCDIANRLGCSLEEASKFIVPVYKFDKEKIDALRAKANEKYISASYAGVYKYSKLTLPDNKPKRDVQL
jgi:hypothetical protein